MKIGRYYKHTNNREMCIRVDDMDFDGECYDVYATYYNLNYHFDIDSEEISIRKEDLHNWKEIKVN